MPSLRQCSSTLASWRRSRCDPTTTNFCKPYRARGGRSADADVKKLFNSIFLIYPCRLNKFNLSAFDIFGLNTQQQTSEMLSKLKIVDKAALPAFSFAS